MDVRLNPFPGLRPFEPDEDYLFFGRDKEIDELLRRLRSTHFLVVTGASGSGKSSLVRSGLIPSLYSGMMARAGSNWRVALLRPGSDPIGSLAAALISPAVLGGNRELYESSQVVMQATLRRSALGLVAAVEQSRLRADEKLLIVVDQFEELFRFRHAATRNEEAVGFVKLLLSASGDRSASTYVVLTMRSDFIGECMHYPGLPEAVNSGSYLVPRMTRDELKSAIIGPVAVGGGEIAPRLLARLLNDAGDDPDQLPVLQHALMRTWDYWAEHRRAGEPIDLEHYAAVGSMAEALSRHAEEAYNDAVHAGYAEASERIFKALTDTTSDPRGVRRPTAIDELAAIAERPEAEICAAVKLFRQPGRSFLMPPLDTPLTSDCVIDISHESLMRRWTRLARWADEDRRAANQYLRIARAARWEQEGTGELLRGVDLANALRWRAESKPTAAWARRFDPDFDKAIAFVERSEQKSESERAERRRTRTRNLAIAWSVAGVFAILFGVAVALYVYAFRMRQQAQAHFEVARDAVTEMVRSASSEAVRVAAEVPQVEGFRRGLLDRAEQLYSKLSAQERYGGLNADRIAPHVRLGDIYKLLDEYDRAIAQYSNAIREYKALGTAARADQSDTYDRLGQVEALMPDRRKEAEDAYSQSVSLYRSLWREAPGDGRLQLRLARTLDNRGILYAAENRVDQARADYVEARRLIDALPQSVEENRRESSRVYNNTGLLFRDLDQLSDARRQFERAIVVGEGLAQWKPEDWDYKLELASFYKNLAIVLFELNDTDGAERRARQALNAFRELARPASSMQIQLAAMHDVLGNVLNSRDRGHAAASAEYERSLDLFGEIATASKSASYHLSFGNALFDWARVKRSKGDYNGAVQLFMQAAQHHAAARADNYVAWDYLFLSKVFMAIGQSRQAREYLEKLSELMASLPEAERRGLEEQRQEVMQSFGSGVEPRQ